MPNSSTSSTATATTATPVDFNTNVVIHDSNAAMQASRSAKQSTVLIEKVGNASVSRAKKTSMLVILSQLSKLRLSSLVVASSSAGFFLGSLSYQSMTMIHTPSLIASATTSVAENTLHMIPSTAGTFASLTIGTVLAAASANTLNQIYEIETDSRMVRTLRRPLPSKRISKQGALAWAVASGVSSAAILTYGCNPQTAILGVANIALYAGIYTPLKQKSLINTHVGAVVGAIPPLMGYVSVMGDNVFQSLCLIEPWILASGLFLWQFPHFYALAWLYKKDYSRGGHYMLPSFDETGKRTANAIMRHSLALSTLPVISTFAGATSPMFLIESLAFNGYLVYGSAKFKQNPNDENARRVFKTSLWYLPLFMTLLVYHSTQTGGAGKELPLIGKEVEQLRTLLKELCVHEYFIHPKSSLSNYNGETNPKVLNVDITGQPRQDSHPSFCPVTKVEAKIDEITERSLFGQSKSQ